MLLTDYDYSLPPELIAQAPCAQRSDARLLVAGPSGFDDRRVSDLPALLAPGDLMVMNDTRVLRARLLGHKSGSGGQVEALIERVTSPTRALAQIRASKPPRAGVRLSFDRAIATVIGRSGEFFELDFEEPVHPVLERCGRTPLPPYIEHAPGPRDDERYQTVYARESGAVAAPTAGLHLDAPLLEALRQAGVQLAWITLHVGAGTFQPVRVSDPAQHLMHAERWWLPDATAEAIGRTRAAGGRVVAIGTTTVRALESAALACGDTLSAANGDTRLFITPGFRFRVVDRLVTNFHLPRSTLLMLVSAFAGIERVRAAYAHAIARRYRFFSYGDASLFDRAEA